MKLLKGEHVKLITSQYGEESVGVLMQDTVEGSYAVVTLNRAGQLYRTEGRAYRATSSRIRIRLLEAGVKYPENWNELGSSEKDSWEDKQIEKLEKQ